MSKFVEKDIYPLGSVAEAFATTKGIDLEIIEDLNEINKNFYMYLARSKNYYNIWRDNEDFDGSCAYLDELYDEQKISTDEKNFRSVNDSPLSLFYCGVIDPKDDLYPPAHEGLIVEDSKRLLYFETSPKFRMGGSRMIPQLTIRDKKVLDAFEHTAKRRKGFFPSISQGIVGQSVITLRDDGDNEPPSKKQEWHYTNIGNFLDQFYNSC